MWRRACCGPTRARCHRRPWPAVVARARRRLGLAPQNLAVYDLLTAEENLAFFGQLFGLAGAALRARVDAALASSALASGGAIASTPTRAA